MRASSRRAFVAGASLALAGCGRARQVDGRKQATLWFAYGGKNREVLLSLVARFNAAQSRYVITPTYQGDYFECLAKVRTAIYAGVAPTLTHVVGEVLPYLASSGVLEPLDDYPGCSTLGLVSALSQRGSYTGADSQPTWGVPFNRSTPLFYCNGALLDAAGLAPPDSWDELLKTADALTVRDGEQTTRWGYEVPIDWWFFCANVAQAGGRLLEDDGTLSLGGAAGERALRLWQRLIHERRSMRPPPGRDYNAWQATNQDFLSGRAAMVCTSTAFLRYMEENARFPVRAARLPGDARRAVPTGGTFFTVLRQSPRDEKEAAWAFLRFMCETPQAIDWATRTGYLPVTVAAVEALRRAGHYERTPNDAVALAQLDDAFGWPWSRELFRVQREIVTPRLEAAVLQDLDPKSVLADARREAASR